MIGEFGFNSRIGRTLEKSGAAIAYADPQRLEPLAGSKKKSLQCRHLRRAPGGFIAAQNQGDPRRKTRQIARRHAGRKKTQIGEEGRRAFSEASQEDTREEDPMPDRHQCIHSISLVAVFCGK